MFTRVLFPTDFSVYANAVFACLPELKAAGMREVVLLGVVHPGDVPLGRAFQPETIDKLQWSAEEALHIAQMALEGKDVRVKTRIEVGSPSAEIVRVAQEENVDLIAIGAQGETAVGRDVSPTRLYSLGSVANEVMRRATVPVLIHKFHVVRELGHVECQRVCAQMFTRVLHPTDFSDCANAAFQIVKRLKSAGTQEVILLHVQDERVMRNRPAQQLAAFDAEDTRRLEQMRRDLVLRGLKAKIELRHGIPFRETLQVAEEENINLIVLGSHGRSAVQEMLAGSTFENVARASRRPVLVIRREMIEQTRFN
jgi:nucleotide-binding universal stress UspA family protein